MTWPTMMAVIIGTQPLMAAPDECADSELLVRAGQQQQRLYRVDEACNQSDQRHRNCRNLAAAIGYDGPANADRDNDATTDANCIGQQHHRTLAPDYDDDRQPLRTTGRALHHHEQWTRNENRPPVVYYRCD
jgi:hypothetical protein